MALHKATRTSRAVGAVLILAGAVLATLGFTTSVGASVNDPSPTPYDNNPSCDDLGYAYEFKLNFSFDENTPDATYGIGDQGVVTAGPVPAGTTVSISNVELVDGRLEFDWASNITWPVLLVKQANGGLRYDYDPAVDNDQDVQTTENNSTGTSHITFCGPPPPDDPEVGSVTLDKVLAGDAAPDDDPSFSFAVECESGTVPNAAPSIKASDEPLVIATDVAVGDSCTITETGDGGADEVALAPDEDAGTPGAQVTIASDGQVVNVVATNTFDETPPTIPPTTPPTVLPTIVSQANNPVQVLGTQTTKQLPQTGTSSTLLMGALGLGMLLVGSLLVGGSRRVAVQR